VAAIGDHGRSNREIKIRAAHEIMAAWTAQLAFLVDQLVTALQAITPVFAGIFGRAETASLVHFSLRF
jgi:hypothetical protein